MNCFFCKGNLVEQNTNFMADIDNCFIIVKNVPSLVCTQCGEVAYTDQVSARLEQIVHSLCQALSEVAIVNYSAA